jgi:flagellar FliL protein
MTSVEQTLETADIGAIEAELPKKRWSGKRIVAAAILAVALAGGLFAAREWARPEVAAPVASPQYVEVPDMMVNLRTAGGERRYLKVRVMIEAASEADKAAIEARLPAIIDGFQSFLRELRPEDLAGASGTYRIKEELMIRVNRSGGPGRARDVLVQELIQQ